MSTIEACALPANALLGRYAKAGAYTDCFTTETASPVSHAQYVEAFYTGGLFRVERWLLAAFVSKPSTDLQAAQLARGERSTFAAWRVEERAPDQLLLCAMDERTRSWLMVSPQAGKPTRLYFGSAVVPGKDREGKPRMGPAFRALLGLHKAYSRALLRAARSRLESIHHEQQRNGRKT